MYEYFSSASCILSSPFKVDAFTTSQECTYPSVNFYEILKSAESLISRHDIKIVYIFFELTELQIDEIGKWRNSNDGSPTLHILSKSTSHSNYIRKRLGGGDKDIYIFQFHNDGMNEETFIQSNTPQSESPRLIINSIKRIQL